MNRNQVLVTIATAAMLCAGSALGSEIYKYTDDDGNVSYVDRPIGQGTAERLDVESARTDNAAVQTRYNERFRTPPADDEEQADGAEEEPRELTRRERAAAAAERQEKCQSYRSRLQSLVDARRVYREDESGERTYLDDVQRAEARSKAQELIDEFCD
jgi:hypothetical protein